MDIFSKIIHQVAESVKLHTEKGKPSKHGTGIFATHILHTFPLLPVEEEGRLHNPRIRENFIECMFCYRRWKTCIQQKRMTRETIVQFHTQHKYVLLTHSHAHYLKLGQLITQSDHFTPRDLANRYGVLFMNALKVKATVQKHVYVLQQMARHLKQHLSAVDQDDLQETIQDYHQHRTSLTVPLTLMKQYVLSLAIPYLVDQVYLTLHLQELILQNHVQ